MDDLKSQTEGTVAFINDTRASLSDIHALRASVSSTIQAIEPYLEGGDEWAKVRQMKDVLNALELESSKSQQVADLLRDRLQSVGGELVEAKSRVTELEAAQAEDRAALSRANAAMARSAEELSSLAACVKKHQGDLYDTLSIAAESEAKLQRTNQRVAELENLLRSKDEQLQALRGVHSDIAKLEAKLELKDTYILDLESSQTEHSQTKAALEHTKLKLAEMTALVASKDNLMSSQSARSSKLERSCDGANTELKTLAEELGMAKAREQAASAENGRILAEKRTLSEKFTNLESVVETVREELDSRSRRYVIRLTQALEDRFEDQSITLRLTRQAVGDAQERLLSSETLHAEQLSESTAKLKQEIAVLQEQKLGLQATIDVMSTALERHEKTLQMVHEEHVDRLKELNAVHTDRLLQEEKRVKELAGDLADAKTRIASSEVHVSRLEDGISDLRRQLEEARLPSPETEAELRTLRSQVATLEAADMRNTVRAKTIESRYRTGDLNDEEKAFIHTLVRTSQAIHEQELVTNRNELRRRDNTLKEMRAKVHLLESTLARHLNGSKPKPAPPAVDGRSMIDPTAWMSSGQSSSPPHAPDRDGQTDVDVVVSVKTTPAHSRIRDGNVSVPVQSNVGQPVFVPDRVQASKAPAEKPVPSPAMDVPPPIKKPNFSRLATDCSDEILDFDDEPGPQKSSPSSTLGKRSKPGSSPDHREQQAGGKPTKRVRATATRKADAIGQNPTSNVPPKRVVQPSGSRNRGRKRR
ncbi:hypothetical protein C8Q77DRAFT_1048544 [Trametes polyzona]|nr:hypothetical protein C8Q77DRAFT_1048544 [Trametes polyzona]